MSEDKREYKKRWHRTKMQDPAYREARNRYNRAYRAARSSAPKKTGHKFCKFCGDFHLLSFEFFYKRKNSTTGYGKCKKQEADYQDRNRAAKNARNVKFHMSKISRDLNYKMKVSLRIRLNRAIKSGYKSGSAIDALGCTISELRKYLEGKFQPGMSWENWSRDGWHIDHIRPLAAFDLSNPEELKKACHYTNLQPLWAKDNLSKGAA